MKRVIALSIVLIVILGLCSCGMRKDSIVGTWKFEDENYSYKIVFKDDGTYASVYNRFSSNYPSAHSGVYTIVDDILVFDLDNPEEFNIKGNKLTLMRRDGPLTLTRIK